MLTGVGNQRGQQAAVTPTARDTNNNAGIHGRVIRAVSSNSISINSNAGNTDDTKTKKDQGKSYTLEYTYTKFYCTTS
jgi:hypothetical protein